VWLVGAGPGDPGLLTLHAAHALAHADVILHDALVAPEILALAGPAAAFEPVGKRAGRPGPAQLRINQRLIELARAGLRVLRLKGGDPFVFGRGGEEALGLAAAGVPFRVVPGITSGIGGLAYAGIPVTHRMLSASVAFVTGQGAASGAPRAVDWAALARGAGTIVLYMALGRLAEIAEALISAGRDPNEPVALLSEATTARQRCLRTTLADAAATAALIEPGAPTLIVIGPVAGLREMLAGGQQVAPARIIDHAMPRAAGAQGD
ncbi:MAG: uroporphyrinogen-III C-methyltransferase, partial [Geminicoccaceae bacterium]